MVTTRMGCDTDDSSPVNTAFETTAENLRTATWEFLDKVQADDCKDLVEQIEDLRIRLDKLDDDPISNVTSYGEGNLDQGTLYADVVVKVTFVKLFLLMRVYLRKAQPNGTGTLDVKTARGMIPLVRDEFGKLNMAFPTPLKMPGEICLGGTLGPNVTINLDYEPIYLLQSKLCLDLGHGSHLNCEDKAKLDDDWGYHANRAFGSLKQRLTCPACGYIHHSPTTTEIKRRLHNNMFGFDSKNITLDNVNNWKNRMHEIEEQYGREAGMSRA